MRIGDPTVWGWTITAGYLLAAWLCFGRWRIGSLNRNRADGTQRWWMMLAVLMLLLGFNKQLDLQTSLTSIGRAIARSNGLYSRRRLIQGLFVIVLTICVVAALAVALKFRPSGFSYGVSFTGLVCLATFVMIRAAAFHHVDGRVLEGLQQRDLHCVLEAIGILVIASSTVPARRGLRGSEAVCLESRPCTDS
jgi:hypothetical protein